jgi:hypothetical protein
MTKKLSEFVTIPRGKLQPVARYSGKSFFTSDVLKRQYVAAMKKSSRGAPIINQIESLVNKSIIIPVYKSKSIIRAILKLQPVQFSGIAGAAVPDKKVIYIFVETSTNLFSFTNSDALASVTLHELIHLLSFVKPKIFFETFKGDLKKFYRFYFCRLLNCDERKVSEAKFNKLIEFLYWKVEHRKYLSLSNKEIKKYYDLIVDTFKEISSLDEKTFIKLVSEYFVTMKLILKLESYGQGHQIIKVATAYKHIITPFYVAYKNVFAINPIKENQFVYQELFVPSEVICMQSIAKTPSPTIYRAVKKL